MKRRMFLIALAVTLVSCQLSAQNRDTFKARLSLVPIDGSKRATVTGSGSATATLNGSTLAIAGTFQGLKGAATMAQLHMSLVTGVRGSSFQDLTVTKGVSGSISGSVQLTPDQVASLKKGKIYIQIHSESAPDGNLWGWLLQ